MRHRPVGLVIVAMSFGACSGAGGHVIAKQAAADRRGDAQLLACLGAPANAIYDPERLVARPAPGLSVHTFDQVDPRCGPLRRRYVAYVPVRLGARTTAPVLLVLHGQGASAEAMMDFQTRGTFNQLADEKGLVIVYGNGLPTAFNFDGLANSGRWRLDDLDTAYLDRVVADLTSRGVIAGGNDVYLIGQSNGGGMALHAAEQQPDRYTGVAAFMPFVGFSPSAPARLAGARLRRVMFAYSDADPGLPPAYAASVLVPMAERWARALGLATSDGVVETATAFDDIVQEGQRGDQGEGSGDDAPAVRATRASTARRLDRRQGERAFRQIVFDHAGHFWPTRRYADPEPVLRRFGLRNQDLEGAEQTWAFFSE